jgi:predicted Rossmann fold nucleotide-binding protein DprA/Smf involved in DNA uptake
MDWALQQAKAKNTVISGFHSPLEQSILSVLIVARSPALVVLARPVATAKLPPDWVEPIEKGNLAVVSTTLVPARLTANEAAIRDRLVAELADSIVVAHTSAKGLVAARLASFLYI